MNRDVAEFWAHNSAPLPHGMESSLEHETGGLSGRGV